MCPRNMFWTNKHIHNYTRAAFDEDWLTAKQYGLAKKKPEADQSERREVKRRSTGIPPIQAIVETQKVGCLSKGQ